MSILPSKSKINYKLIKEQYIIRPSGEFAFSASHIGIHYLNNYGGRAKVAVLRNSSLVTTKTSIHESSDGVARHCRRN